MVNNLFIAVDNGNICNVKNLLLLDQEKYEKMIDNQ